MGTKANPGAYDCYAAADPDEPMFILLARDPLAAVLVDLWAALREQHGCADHPVRSHDAKVAEARQCAQTMRNYRAALPLKKALASSIAAGPVQTAGPKAVKLDPMEVV